MFSRQLNKMDLGLKMFKWINIFVRDLLLVFVILGLQIMTNFNSKVVFLITGMLIVWITWQFADLLNEVKEKRLK